MVYGLIVSFIGLTFMFILIYLPEYNLSAFFLLLTHLNCLCEQE